MRIDEVLAQENAAGEVFWGLADHQGSVRLLMDNLGNVVNNITYDSFGNVTVETNAGTSFRFTYAGREYDSETGQYYYRSRLLDPLTGGFIQEDKIGFAGGDSNLYRYVGNSPLIYTDPYGENLYSILNNADKFSAGFADTVTLGGSTWLRNKLYGEQATRNHTGALFNAGQISGAVTTAALGFGTPGNLAQGLNWAQKAAIGYEVASTGIGAYKSTTRIMQGCADWTDALSFAPLVGYGLSKLKGLRNVNGLNGLDEGGRGLNNAAEAFGDTAEGFDGIFGNTRAFSSGFNFSSEEILDAFSNVEHTDLSKSIFDAIQNGNIDIKFDPNINGGGFSTNLNNIVVNSSMNMDDILAVTVHEGRHYLDKLNGLIPIENPGGEIALRAELRAFADSAEFATKNNLTNAHAYGFNPNVIGDFPFVISIAESYEGVLGELPDSVLTDAVSNFRDDKILKKLTDNL